MRILVTGFLAMCCAVCSWIVEAFQYQALILQPTKTSTSTSSSSSLSPNLGFYRSLSGLLAASTGTLSTLLATSTLSSSSTALRMVATTSTSPQEEDKGIFWILPAWMPMKAMFLPKNRKSKHTRRSISAYSPPESLQSSSSSSSSSNIDNNPSQSMITAATLNSKNLQDDESNAFNTKSQVRGIYVAGYMDYDPKLAARNAYKTTTRKNTKRDGYGWFL